MMQPAVRRRWLIAMAGLLFAAQLTLIALLTARGIRLRPTLTVQLAGFAISLFLLLTIRLMNLGRRAVAVVLLGGCALLQCAAMLGSPVSSDDDYRYLWDAKVQLSGTDPYRYVPSDPALQSLRANPMFDHQSPCRSHPIVNGCTAINRPNVHTAYPPVAEAVFTGIRLLSLGGKGNHLPLQLAGALGVLATTGLLIRLATVRAGPVWPVAAWALSPLVAVEATNNAHIEWLAMLFSVGAVLAAARGRKGRSGLLIGAAIATKLYPGVLLTITGRRPIRALVMATAVVVLSYLPHLLVVGGSVLGYLPAYLREEQYSSGGRYLIVSALVGAGASSLVAPILLIGLLAWLWWSADRRPVELTALFTVGGYLLVTTPGYSWYALSLVAMIAATGRFEWLWLSFAPSLLYMAGDIGLSRTSATWLGYAAALALVVAARVRPRESRRREGAV